MALSRSGTPGSSSLPFFLPRGPATRARAHRPLSFLRVRSPQDISHTTKLRSSVTSKRRGHPSESGRARQLRSGWECESLGFGGEHLHARACESFLPRSLSCSFFVEEEDIVLTFGLNAGHALSPSLSGTRRGRADTVCDNRVGWIDARRWKQQGQLVFLRYSCSFV